MDKKIASSRRLQLNRETLRSLTNDELGAAAGGTGYQFGGGLVVVKSDGFLYCNVGGGGVWTAPSYPQTVCGGLPGGYDPAGGNGG